MIPAHAGAARSTRSAASSEAGHPSPNALAICALPAVAEVGGYARKLGRLATADVPQTCSTVYPGPTTRRLRCTGRSGHGSDLRVGLPRLLQRPSQGGQILGGVLPKRP